MEDLDKPIEIAPQTYWVGSNQENQGLGCNPYLLVDHDGQGVLFDPGSKLDYAAVSQKVREILPLEDISTIILSHQDPDLASAVPLFEEAGFQGQIALHWRTAMLVQYYGISSPYYRVNENRFRLSLSGDRTLQFLSAPYLHFPGAVMTYDPETKTLFSGDLFGALGSGRQLYADAAVYPEGMRAFHEHYMPSRRILRSAMNKLLPLDIQLIAPQHGSIINQSIPQYIDTLRRLECGTLLADTPAGEPNTPSAAPADPREEDYPRHCGRIADRINSLFPHPDWSSLLADTSLQYIPAQGASGPKETSVTSTDLRGADLWDTFFSLLHSRRGAPWLSAVEPLVRQLCSRYNLPLPGIYQSLYVELEMDKENLSRENREMADQLRRQQDREEKTEKEILTCPITGLRNERYFRSYILEDLQTAPSAAAFLFLSLDHLSRLNLDHGKEEGDRALASLAYLAETLRPETAQLFKLKGPQILLYLPEADQEQARRLGEKLRTQTEESSLFLTPVTISLALVLSSENGSFDPLDPADRPSPQQQLSRILSLGLARLNEAHRRGGNTVFLPAEEKDTDQAFGKARVLIIDPDEYYTQLLEGEFRRRGWNTQSAADGEEALEKAENNPPQLIISEVSVPMADGLQIRSQLMGNPDLRSVPFILVSYRKDDLLIQQAHALRISHYLQKPVSILEILGLAELHLPVEGPPG